MRLHLGDVARTDSLPPADGLREIDQPGARLGFLIAGLVGLLLPCILGAAIVALAAAGARGAEAEVDLELPTPWGVVLLTMLTYVPLHELIHLLCHPRFGLSERSVVVMWPTRFRFGVYYDGCMSRRRWLMMRLAPFFVLSVIPAAILACSQPSYIVSTCLTVLMLVNSVGSGGDVVATVLVARQVPPAGQLCFQGGRAYWRVPEQSLWHAGGC